MLQTKKNFSRKFKSLLSYAKKVHLEIPETIEDAVKMCRQDNIDDDKKVKEAYQDLKQIVVNSLLENNNASKYMCFLLFIIALNIAISVGFLIFFGISQSFSLIFNIPNDIIMINTVFLGNGLFCLWEIKRNEYLLWGDISTDIYIWLRFVIGITITAFVFYIVSAQSTLEHFRAIVLVIFAFPFTFFYLQDIIIKIIEYIAKPKVISEVEQQGLIRKNLFEKLHSLHEKIEREDLVSAQLIALSILEYVTKIGSQNKIAQPNIETKKQAEEFLLQIIMILLPNLQTKTKKKKEKVDKECTHLTFAEQYTKKTLEKLHKKNH